MASPLVVADADFTRVFQEWLSAAEASVKVLPTADEMREPLEDKGELSIVEFSDASQGHARRVSLVYWHNAQARLGQLVTVDSSMVVKYSVAGYTVGGTNPFSVRSLEHCTTIKPKAGVRMYKPREGRDKLSANARRLMDIWETAIRNQHKESLMTLGSCAVCEDAGGMMSQCSLCMMVHHLECVAQVSVAIQQRQAFPRVDDLHAGGRLPSAFRVDDELTICALCSKLYGEDSGGG